MGLWHDIETFVRAAKRLDSHQDIQFIFVGGGMRKKRALDLAREIGIKNIHWKEFVPLNELSESLAGCHLALISLNQNLEGVAVPCKLYGILASGRPTIAQVPAKSEVAMTVIENCCGLVIEPGDVEGLADAIYRLSKDMESVRAMSLAAFKAYSKNYKIIDNIGFIQEIEKLMINHFLFNYEYIDLKKNSLRMCLYECHFL
jgi:glycosyltransferase involved in cell wall biosynthesis